MPRSLVPPICQYCALGCELYVAVETKTAIRRPNSGSTTRRSQSLQKSAPRLLVEVNPLETAEPDTGDGDCAVVSTIRGRTRAKAHAADRTRKGVIFMPFHYPGANTVTTDAHDAEAKIADFKAAACSISRRN